MDDTKADSALRTYVRSLFRRRPKPTKNNAAPHLGVSATLQSNTIVAGKDVQMQFGGVTNVYHSFPSAPQPDNGAQSHLGNIRPPRPVHMLERDTYRERITNALLGSPDTRVAILGMGGIGKTTLAASVMWDSRILEAYPKQYFLSFEGLSTPELAYGSLANTFEIPQDDRKSYNRVMSYIMEYLTQKMTLLCIDNFETFWEIPANRLAADGFLNQLSSLSTLAIIVTLRGSQEPGSIDWLRFGPLQPLTQAASNDLVHKITRREAGVGEEECMSNLLEAVAGVPLAVTLIGNLLRDDSETPRSLWHRWTQESTRAIGMDVPDRQYQLDVSLRLSVFGPRMSDNSRAVLVAISLLPSGLSSEEIWLDDFRALLPSSFHLRHCLQSLRNTALCSLDLQSSPPRYQILSPIRQFCLKNLPIDGEATCRLIDLYSDRLYQNEEYESSTEYTWFTNELTNITAILNFALSLPYITDSLAYACATYTQWMHYIGSPTTDIIRRATNAQPEGSQAKPRCLQSHAYVLSRQAQYEEAMTLLQEALSIHREIGDLVEEGRDLFELGAIYRALDRLDDAEGTLNNASKLYQELEDQTGEANCLRALAELYSDMDKCSEAESSAKQAIELYRSTGNQLGEANALNALGRVYLSQGQLDLAIEISGDARQIATEIKYTFGQGVAMRCLGLAHEDTGSLNEAASCLQEAITLYDKASYPAEAQMARDFLSRVLSTLESERGPY